MDGSQFSTLYSLSAMVGLRPFLTLAVVSLAMHFGYIHLAHPYLGLGTDGATWVLGGLALLEFLSDKIPAVDNAMHVLHFATKPVAAAILVGSAMAADDGGLVTTAAMGLGAINALGVHTASVAVRGTSTATTLGVANPFISVIEDLVALGGIALAFLAPFLSALLAVGVTLALVIVAVFLVRGIRANAPQRTGGVQFR